MESVLVVIAAPGSGAIGRDEVAALAALGAGEPRWLASGEALEVPAFKRLPEFLAQMASRPLDAAVVPALNRRKRLLIADMDSTMIRQECIDELGEAAGAGQRIRDITLRAMRGELDFEGALKERVALLAGLGESVIGTIIRERITFMPGGAALLATMKAHGAWTALVSGGFEPFTRHVAEALGFDEQQANRLVVRDGRLAGKVARPILGQQAKVEALRRIAVARGIETADAIAVGDGANDLAMLAEAGMGVALHAKPQVQEQAKIRINHGDLTALLYLQGYARDEFVQ